jgi:hypothetical protein
MFDILTIPRLFGIIYEFRLDEINSLKPNKSENSYAKLAVITQTDFVSLTDSVGLCLYGFMKRIISG